MKYKNIPNYKYTIKDIKERIKFLEQTNNEDSINDVIYDTDKNIIRNAKNAYIKDEKKFKLFLSHFAEISLSDKYKYNVFECLNTLKEIFQENNIDSLSSFIYIQDMFRRYKYTDVSVILNKITDIIEANKNNRIFLSRINKYIRTEQYNILVDEKLMLETLLSSLTYEEEQMKEKAKEEAINNIVARYFEDFKQICK